jgi:hypothetical protein
MKRCAILLTAALLLMHSCFGCCAHALQDANCCDEPHGICVELPEHEASHACAADEPLEERSPEQGHGCCRVKCQWLAPDAAADLAAALLSYAAIFDADQTAVTFAATTWRCEISPLDALPALPVRAHLALGVLLI